MGDSLHQFMRNLAQPRGTWDRLAVQNLTPIGAQWRERGTQNCNNSHFLVKSRQAGRTLWPISTAVRGFYTPNHPALVVFYIWDDSITGYGVIAEKPRISHLPEIFRAPYRKNCSLDRKIIGTLLMISMSSINVQNLGKVEQGAPTVGEKICCLYVFLFFFPARMVCRRAVHSRSI